MSWAEEDWTVGLSGRVLQKVKELQILKDRLTRESKQKQLQLDNIHASAEQQTVKYEEVRGELQSSRRELQRVQDEAKAAVTSTGRLTQELRTKQAQICSFEGQLDAAHTLNNKLILEIKRLEAELEKLQNSSRSADTTLFSTPCWNTASPWEHNGSRREERGHRDEGQSRVLHSRRLQFSDVGTPSLPRLQHKSTPHRHPSDQSDSFSTPSSMFPWERDDSRPAERRQSPPSPQMPCTDTSSQVQTTQGFSEKKDNRTETDTSLSASMSRVSTLEEDLRVKNETLKSIMKEMAQSKKDLSAKELSIQRAQNDLSLVQTRMAQESERASGAEQRVKQLQEELRCQRQNAESSRLQHQQRTKEQEKQHQRDLAELQKERQCLERQHQQEVNKLNQELQQARILHNTLQAQADKLSLQKQALEKDLDTLKEKLKWTEGQLQDSQKKEAQTQAKLTEAAREAEQLAVCLDQSRKKESALEKEGRRLADELADALRLVKELQEKLAAPPVLLNPAPFCPVGQSFSPQPSYSLNPRTSTHIRSTAAHLPDQKREENVDKRRVASYPSEREPGEGIDSEQIISPDSEGLQREGHKRKVKEENKSKNVTSVTNSTFDQELSTSCHSGDTPTNFSTDSDCSTLTLSAEKESSLKTEQDKTFKDLRGENETLRSELHDTREELQKRLDDLEAQRRAEAEARTRLKQLSRKRASQSVEKEEQEKEWRAQLEKEKAETEKLRKAMAALETQLKRGKEEREKNDRLELEEEKTKVLEDRESEMIELNFQLKKQLTEVKSQLALEREERKMEEEERNLVTNTGNNLKKEMSIKLQELEDELELLKINRKKSSEEEKLSLASSPLTYLTLNSNIACYDKSLLPSPEQHFLLCESSNQRNTLESQKTSALIHEEEAVIEHEFSPHVASDHEDTTENYQVGSSLSEKRLSGVQEDEPASSDMKKELKRLQKEKLKEAKRANQYQVKLEALQSQVTLQTQQLTQAFEKQSQHISGLLAELQAKESALLSQGEELQRYKHKLDASKDQKDRDEKKKVEQRTVQGRENGQQKENAPKERLREMTGLQPDQDKNCVIPFLNVNPPAASDCAEQRDVSQPESVTSDSERSTHTHAVEALCSGKQYPDSFDSDRTQTHRDTRDIECIQDGEKRQDVAGPAELQALQQENQLLKQRILDLSVSNVSGPALQTDNENPEVKQSENTGNVCLPCIVEPRSSHTPCAVRKESEGGDLEREDRSAEEEHRAASLQVNRLQQQVVELQMKIQALSEETEQQAMELTVWRLSSGPAPTFDLPNTDIQSESQNRLQTDETTHILPGKQSPALSPTVQAQFQKPYPGVKESSGGVTIIREDELLLSCSSSKLQGHMLLSRLQHSNLPESKNLHPSKKTSTLQKYNQDPANIDKDSEKENQLINFSHPSKSCQSQLKQKKDAEVIQTSTEKTCQQHVSKDSHTASGAKQTKASKCHLGNPEGKSDVSRQINASRGSSGRDIRTEMKSVNSQTEESFYPGSAPQESIRFSCASTQTEEVEDEEEPMESPTASLPSSELGDTELFSGVFPIPADPASLAERIRRNRTQLSAAFDDTEYEPYGLPEVVMKGFADIPSGPSCPYIVRRGLLGTAVGPVTQKNQEQEETD
ncbi:centromere protein F isoform X2 [Antennarius striatus]|uniref:centromere protein F isoform X2 n=1 Tax=Antennarius striatus TaxID=241820 RepID=UPI0035AFE579